MSTSHHSFVADQYGPRADSYISSSVHATGEDLDGIEAAVRGCVSARVLDLGCGGGHVSYRASPHVAQVVAVDLAMPMLEAVKRTVEERGLKNIIVRQFPAERLPFASGEFDFVLCRFSAHHWHGFEAGLREARRVLTERGRAIFIDVVSSGNALLDTHLQALELLRDASHVRNYNASEWMGTLTRAGFAVRSMRTRRLRIEFSSWVARTRTPPLHVDAIRLLQERAPAEVRQHLAIGPDGSFMLEAATFEASAQSQ